MGFRGSANISVFQAGALKSNRRALNFLSAIVTDDSANKRTNVSSVLTGVIDGATGNIVQGSGFTCVRSGAGVYVVTFTTAFASPPTAVASPYSMGGTLGHILMSTTTTQMSVNTYSPTGAAPQDESFSFLVSGTA